MLEKYHPITFKRWHALKASGDLTQLRLEVIPLSCPQPSQVTGSKPPSCEEYLSSPIASLEYQQLGTLIACKLLLMTLDADQQQSGNLTDREKADVVVAIAWCKRICAMALAKLPKDIPLPNGSSMTQSAIVHELFENSGPALQEQLTTGVEMLQDVELRAAVIAMLVARTDPDAEGARQMDSYFDDSALAEHFRRAMWNVPSTSEAAELQVASIFAKNTNRTGLSAENVLSLTHAASLLRALSVLYFGDNRATAGEGDDDDDMDSDSEDSDEDGAPVSHRKDTHRRRKYDRTRRATEEDNMSFLKTAQRVAERATIVKEKILEARNGKTAESWRRCGGGRR